MTAVYNHFGSVHNTVKATGLSDYIVRKYVRINRLPPPLKTEVENGQIKLTAALDAADIHDYDSNDPNSADVSVIVATAREMQKLAGKQKKRVKERKNEQPEKPVDEIIDEVKSVQRRTREITITIESDTYERVSLYKDNSDDVDTISLAAAELVEEGLTANRL